MIEIIKLNRALSAVHSSNIFFFLNEKLEKPIIVKRKARKLKLMINLDAGAKICHVVIEKREETCDSSLDCEIH